MHLFKNKNKKWGEWGIQMRVCVKALNVPREGRVHEVIILISHVDRTGTGGPLRTHHGHGRV